MLNKIKDQANNVLTPTKVHDKVFFDCRDVLEANSCGSLQRNKKQVANMKFNLKNQKKKINYFQSWKSVNCNNHKLILF